MGETGAVPEIVLVRHGQTEWSRDHRHTGRTDVPLTDEGRDQARQAGEWLAGRSFASVITSPLSRALETCRLAGFGDRAERRDELMEWDYGEYDGLTTPEIREQRPGWFLWRDGCPGGELPGDVARRVDPLVAELRDVAGDAALFAHGHVLRVLCARWLELGPEAGAKLVLDTATLSALGWERESPAIRVWNARGPLPG
jgi:broad specificity phosphatase PhoE